MNQPTVDLFTSADPLLETYSRVYSALSELRESFHRSGRLDDSNAKLDEVAKIFATYIAFKTGSIPFFPNRDSTTLIGDLQDAFLATADLPVYKCSGQISIFGSQPSLFLRAGDEVLAKALVNLVRESVDFAFALRSNGQVFDILNEAFGHFVRDNFRGNTEDAQYMTPPEVVDFMADLALRELREEDPAAQDNKKHWIIADPTCGVGSFLGAIYQRAKQSEWLSPSRLRLIGQDKVERMVRLSTINLQLFEAEEHRVTLGNSLTMGSPLDDLNGKVDLILTNPPFGARFEQPTIASHFRSNTPFFASLRRSAASVDSELLFVDRNLRLLREGGRLFIIVPDGVVSAKGSPSLLRQHITSVATLRAVIELPSATFAQAGTRTKTVVLYVQKGRSPNPPPVLMCAASSLGFDVNSRKGIQVKMRQGENELPKIFQAFDSLERRAEVAEQPKVLLNAPSCVLVDAGRVLRGSWTPSHYSASMLSAVSSVTDAPDLEMVPLSQLVDFVADKRKNRAWREGTAYISVLHLLTEGVIDVGGALRYAPKTPGVPINPGELLMSRINPRIPRVCVAPDLRTPALCSSEFEVMIPNGAVDVYTLAYLLQTPLVCRQVQSLTSGTSASHNRIRTSELAKVMVPIPRAHSQREAALQELVKKYRTAVQSLSANAALLAELRGRDAQLFPQEFPA